jgi:hypothetical protein
MTTTTLTRASGARPSAVRSAPCHPRPRADRELRLTRRGRIVVVALLLGLLLVAFTLFSARSAASRHEGQAVPTRTVVVDEGDTLWGIAAAVAEPGQTRELVHRIQKVNSLPTPALVVGQELAVPIE